MNGKFVISLDFELHWGIFDVKDVADYKENLENTRKAIYRILELCKRYDIRLTFSTVGFLFSKNKEGLKSFIPDIKPSYANYKLDPYRLIDLIGDNEEEDPYHYAQTMIKEIASYKSHEIGTHTFCHYYCFAEGQTIDQFNADIEAAISIANNMDIPIKSIVFPRNQVNNEYLVSCAKNGITSYRGTENSWIYKPKKFGYLAKALRLLDSYINIFGYHTYSIQELKDSYKICLNLPSSGFLRPYNKKLHVIEPLKLHRVKKAMTYAAKNNELYHLWWHPHNFGSNLDKNIANLESIFKHFKNINSKYNFESETMTSLTNKVLAQIKH